VAKETEKNVRFILEGTDVELDRKILEELNSPLIHIVRNSIYHGIESPSTRKRKGKPEQGTILLRTIRREGAVHIQIKDDGAGLDDDEIKNKAVKNGLYTRQEVEELNKNELNKIIFQPGFSTLKSADMISGRGMGLAIVSEKIKELSGELRLESEPGKGCTFTLAVPFSRAILKAQLMKIAGDLYAIPIENINQIYFFKRELIEYVKGKEYYRLNEKLVPIVRLKEYLNIESEFDTIEFEETEDDEAAATKIVENNLDKFDKIAIFCKRDEDNAVLFVVDEIMQQMDVVIKPFRSKFSQFQDVLGVTITGDGSICLIIDVLSLISRMANEMKTLSVIKNTEQKITH
jgi:two-component system chemotaxis sensor kinase CheA